MDFSLILELISQQEEFFPEYNNLHDFISQFYQYWLSLGRLVQEQLVQSEIETIEAQYSGARTKKKKRYYTPLGEMVIKRRAYSTSEGLKFKVDQELKLPDDKWLPQVLELASALGVSSEFPNAHKLFQKWTNIEITEKTLANQVEKKGNQLQKKEFETEKKSKEKKESSPKPVTFSTPSVIYVGVDGVMTPLNQKQGYKEAKVGVIFWKKDHQKRNKRGIVRHREYIATLKSRDEFRGKIEELYHKVIGEKRNQTVVIGDGAHWIWDMAETQFPGAIEILDFYHLSEYVWKVAKVAYPKSEENNQVS